MVSDIPLILIIEPNYMFSSDYSNSLNIVCTIDWVAYSPMARETGVQYQVESYQILKNGTWYLLPYKVHIQGKVEQSKERSSAFPYTSV